MRTLTVSVRRMASPQGRCFLPSLLLLSLALSACAPGYVRLSEVRQLPLSLEGGAEQGTVMVSGRWVRATTRQRSALASLNAVQVACYRAQSRCTEAVASLHSSLDPLFREVTGGGLLLTSEITGFQVVEWSPSTIRAISQPRAADIEIRISLPERTVVRTATETSARGATGANPTPEVWRLE